MSLENRTERRERGSFLILVMVFVAITTIGLGIAAQAYSVKLRRDKEEELIFRAKQYVQAILAYRKENGGRFPLNLEDLYKPGPRGLRYVRKLYKEPLAKNGRWGLLYLMPGGQGVYDPVAAQQARKQAKDEWGSDAPIGAEAAGAAGIIPINTGQQGMGKQGGTAGQQGGLQGAVPGAMPVGAFQGGLPPPAPEDDAGIDDEERVSETPIGWPIVGVVSRAFSYNKFSPMESEAAAPAEKTFKIYKGHDEVTEWQFHVFDLGADLPQAPGGVMPPVGPQSLGPGHGGKGLFGGMGPQPGGGRMFPGMGQPNKWGIGAGGQQGGAQQGGQQQGQQKGN